MPKPQGTYLQIKRKDRVVRDAEVSRRVYTLASAAQAHRLRLDGIDIEDAQRIAREAHAVGHELTGRGDRAREALAKLVEHLDEIRESLDKLEKMNTELQAPRHEFRAVTQASSNVTPANAVSMANAVLTLLLVVHWILRGRRGG